MDDLNLFEKAIYGLHNGIEKVNTVIKVETGIDCMKKLQKQQIKDEELKKNKPLKWTAKHLTIGTIQGLFGASFYNKD